MSDERDDTGMVTMWMRQLSAEPLQLPAVLNPTILWWKAQMLRQWDAQHQAAVPLDIGDYVEAGLAACASVVLLSWVLRDLWGRIL
jgi:hypothetical protein